jgi:beta-N-acetylhexosaminidase
MKQMFWCLFFWTTTLSADWASETLETLTLSEKIGQLFVAAVYPTQETAEEEKRSVPTTSHEDRLVCDLHIGGLLFKHRWMIHTQGARVQALQALSPKIPLFIAQDLECGLGVRIMDALRFPKNMTLGAIQNDDLLRDMGRYIGNQARAVGVNFVLAPVVDVNTNPQNPVIHMRSFGDDPERVAKKGEAVCRGLQAGGVLACAKHFPGHGDTESDSHKALPRLLLDRQRLERVEFLPFRRLIAAGVESVLVAHLSVPALDPSLMPASLSHPIVTGILRDSLGFEGLIVTDDLLMEAIQKHFGPGIACKLAFLAGNDLIISSIGTEDGMRCLQEAVANGEIALEEIDRRVLRVLRAKQRLQAVPELSLAESGEALQRDLYRAAMTLRGNRANTVNLAHAHFVQIGGQSQESFWTELGIAESQIQHCALADEKCLPNSSEELIAAFYPAAHWREGFLVSIPTSDRELQPFWEWSAFLRAECQRRGIPLTIVWFGSPYDLRGISEEIPCLVAYECAFEAQQAAADVLLGTIQARGILPVNIP